MKFQKASKLKPGDKVLSAFTNEPCYIVVKTEVDEPRQNVRVLCKESVLPHDHVWFGRHELRSMS